MQTRQELRGYHNFTCASRPITSVPVSSKPRLYLCMLNAILVVVAFHLLGVL